MPRRRDTEDQDSAVRLVLRTLGVVECASETSSGERRGRFGPGKPLALLVYLAHSPNRAAPRDHLVELLWSDVEPDAARHSLRQTIWYVRRTLGDGVLATDGDLVRLTAWSDSDAHDFLRAVDAHDEDKALALYTGDFLTGIAIPGGGEFERWADLERLRLRAIFTRTSESRVLHFLARGEARLALPVARRARDSDPGDERLWRRLLEVHIAANDVIGAASEADAFERLWQADERETDAATRALLRRSRNQPVQHGDNSGTAESTTLAADLVGRAAEFAALTGAWDDVQRDGSARHLHLTAPAGFGKSRLLLDFRARLRASRSRTVLVRANPGERSLPYALISTLAQALAEIPGAAAIAPAAASVLVRLNPALSSHFPESAATGEEAEPLRRRTAAVRELAAAVSDERAVALLVDDLHWADRESLAVLAACAGNFGGARVLLVTSARGNARQWFAHEPRELALQPLDPRSIAELVASLGQLPVESWADQLPALLLGATGGSPLLALETLQLAMERDLLAVRDGHWVCGAPSALLALLGETNPLAQRVGQLDDASRQLMALLSAAGVPCSTRTLAAAAPLASDRAEALLQTLEVRGLAQRVGEQWLPAHDEIAASMLATLDTATVSRARLAVARAVAADPSADLGALRLSAELLVASGDSSELAELFARFTREREAVGVRGTAEEHLRALLGDVLPASIRRRMLRAAPWQMRVALRWLAAASLALVALGAVAWSRREAAAAVAVHLIGIETDSATVEPMTLDLPASLDLSAGTIELSKVAEPSELPALDGAQGLVPAPDGSGWYAKKTFADDGGDDLVFLSRNGDVRRLEHSPGDDSPVTTSPDGSLVAINTTRFSATMKTMTGIFDLRRRTVTALHRSGEKEGPTSWHPDGTHILVGREAEGTGVHRSSCIFAVDGTFVRCFAGWLPVGWGAGAEFLALSDSSGRMLASIDVNTGRVREHCTGVQYASVSPDGAWVLARGERAGWDGAVFWLARLATPCEGAVLLHRGNVVRAMMPYWDILRPNAHWLDRIVVNAPDTLTSVAPVRLSVTGLTREGRTIAPLAVRWNSLDSGVATVTRDGLLIPKANGVARIVASAGGWRTDTARVIVARRAALLQSRSVWSSGAALAAWYLFGTPRPIRVISRGREVLSLNGDSSFSSGIRLREVLSVKAGLAVRVRSRMRVTADQWQTLDVNFRTAAANSAWEAWDRATGPIPALGNPTLVCQLGVPAGEGPTARKQFGMGGNGDFTVIDAPPQLTDGRWAWVELQVLPDGRCGVAVDGTPIGLTRTRQPVGRLVELMIQGYAHRTQSLVDTVEVYRGVLHPEWWTALDATYLQGKARDFSERAASAARPLAPDKRPVHPR